MNEPSKPSQVLFAMSTAVLAVSCGMGPGLTRYMPGLKVAMNLLPDLCVALLFAVVIFAPRGGRRRRSSAWGVAWVFLFWILAASIPSIVTLTEQAIFGLRAMVWGLVIALLMQSVGLAPKFVGFIRAVVLVVLLGNMSVALFQAVVGLSALELQSLVDAGASYQVETQTRLLGLQATGQELSMLAGSAFVWSCGSIASRGFRSVGALVWTVGLTSAVVTLVVLQRSALIGALVALGVVVVSIGSSSFRTGRAAASRRLTMVIGASTFAVVVLAVLSPDRVDLALARFQSLFGLSADHSFNVRQETTLPVALHLIAQEPLGYGLGASGPVAARYVPSGPLSDYPLGGIAADNGYLFVALQVGIPGAIFFLLLLVVWAWKGGFIELGEQERLAPRAVICFLGAIMMSGSFWGLTGSMAIIALLASLDSWDLKFQKTEIVAEMKHSYSPLAE